MSKNPLFRNECYFFSDTYDDSLITDFYEKISSETYSRSIDYQQNAVNRRCHRLDNSIYYKSTLGELQIDNDYNRLVGLPTGSRSIKIDTLVLPIHDKYKYISEYGNRYKKIHLDDFLKRNDIFDRSITIQIGRYRIMDAYLIENIDKSVSLVLTDNYLDIFDDYNADEPIWIFIKEMSRAFHVSKVTAASAILSNITINNKKYKKVIKIPKSAMLNKDIVCGANDTNSWDCIISYMKDGIKYYKNIFISYPCTCVGDSNEEVFFSISYKFIKHYNDDKSDIEIYMIHRPYRKNIITLSMNDSTPIINLDYDNNPSGNINVEIYAYDNSTNCRESRIYSKEFKQKYFPNIFNFEEIIPKDKLIETIEIDLTEYPSSYTNQKMSNSLCPLIESLGKDFYTSYVHLGYDKSLNSQSMNLANYYPTTQDISLEDYLSEENEYYGDYRGYVLNKIYKTIETDPYLIAQYYEWIGRKNPKVITKSGTPKYFGMGTGISQGEFSGSNEPVLDTSFISDNSSSIKYFDKPHSYLSYYASGNRCPANLYVDGKYVKPTHYQNYRGINYLFIPTDDIESRIGNYGDDSVLKSVSPIAIDFYPSAYVSDLETASHTIDVNSIDDNFELFSNLEDRKFSLNELSVYDKYSGEMLGKLTDVFNVYLEVTQYEFDNPGKDKITLSKSEDINYFLTSNNEIFCTMDEKPIILSTTNVTYEWNAFIDEMVENKIIDLHEKSKFMNKKLDFSDIKISLKDNTYTNRTLVIYSTSFKSEYVINSSDGIYDISNNNTTYIIPNANIDLDVSRYLVFINGNLNIDYHIESDNDNYHSDLILKIEGNLANRSNEIIVVHLPIDYTREEYFATNKVFYMNKASTAYNVENIWKNCTNGIILQSKENNNSIAYPFEDERNIKFTSTGLRIPAAKKSTNRIHAQYLEYDTVENFGSVNSGSEGIVLRVAGDLPIINIGNQNPHANNYDSKKLTNPLDILTSYIQNK